MIAKVESILDAETTPIEDVQSTSTHDHGGEGRRRHRQRVR